MEEKVISVLKENDKQLTINYLNNVIKDYKRDLRDMIWFTILGFVILFLDSFVLSKYIYNLINGCYDSTVEMILYIVLSAIMTLAIVMTIHAFSEFFKLRKEMKRNINKVKETISDIENGIIK